MMDRLTSVRLVIAAVAIVIWGYGLQSENGTLRIVAMVLLAVSLALRFFRRKPRDDVAPE